MKFFSNTHCPQLMAPFYSILFETSICQFNSSTCSPIMSDEVREHLTRDQRHSFIQNHSRSSDSHLHDGASLQFSSLVFFRVQVRGQEWPSQKLAFVLTDTFLCCFWGFVFELLLFWKIQTLPIIRFLIESVTYWFVNLLVFDKIYDAMHLNKMFRTFSRNIGPQHKKYRSIFHYTHGVLFIPVFIKPILSVCC